MDPIELQAVCKKFMIPHEKRSTIFEHAVGFLTGKREFFKEFWALRNVSFTVKKGEAFGIIGKNGSGKSTLLRIVGSIYPPTSGSVKVRGRIMPFVDIGVGLQHELTGRDNVYLYGSVFGLPRRRIEEKYNEIVDFAELGEFMDLQLKHYSSGMLTRLAFSTAIMTDPDILLIDEVLAVGDISFKKKCLERMDEYRNAGKTILFVSHQMEQVKALCERSLLLHDSEVRAIGETDQVAERYLEYLHLEKS